MIHFRATRAHAIIHPVHDVAAVDLNLLVVLDALLTEHHVTHAGRQVGLSQPATSNALKRLRRLFGDPLLVRFGATMELTPVAQALREPVRVALDAVRVVLAEQAPFDPATTHARWRVSATDHGMMLLVPELQRRLSERAPGITVEISQFGLQDDIALLADERLDLAIGTFPLLPPLVRRQHLFHDELVCLLREGHPALRPGTGSDDALDLDDFLATSHFRIASLRGQPGVVAEALSQRRLQRHVAAEIPSFLAAAFLCESTDLVTTLSSRVAARFATLLPLAVRQPPFPLPGFDTDMVWHARSDDLPLHRWLRDEIVAVVASMASDEEPVAG